MDYAALTAELTAGHPGTGAYDADAATAAGQLNALNRDRNRETMTGSEVLNNIDETEWLAKTDVQRQQVWDIVHLGTLNPFGIEATLMTTIFGGGSTTITALAAARKDSISRADELGLPTVTLSHVQVARGEV